MKKSHPYKDKTIYFATMHGKETIVSECFRQHLGAEVKACRHFDTDVFGSFCHTFNREHSALTTCEEKAKTYASHSHNNLVLASEGSFGPHPEIPWVACDEEIIVFWDAEKELLISEFFRTTETNYLSFDLESSNDEALDSLLEKMLFPSHAVMLFHSQSNQLIAKGIKNLGYLKKLLKIYPNARLATDMRAHVNPTRQKNILAVAEKLIKRLQTLCPGCNELGFGKKSFFGSKVCSLCGLQTRYPDRIREHCISCDFYSDTLLEQTPDKITMYCNWCNP